MNNQLYSGDIIAKPGKVYNYAEVGGYIDADGADTKTAFPKLTSVGGAIYARGADTKTAFPKLTSVGGYIYADGADTKTAFPKLTSVGGYIYADGADTKTAFPKLTSVGGSIYARGADTKTAFPKLTSVGGYIDARGADTKTAFPKLTSVGGSIDARGADTKTAFPKLTSVGGSIDADGADTKTAFPKLTSVGGYIDARGDWSCVAQHDADVIARVYAELVDSFSAAGFSFADEMLARIVSRRGNVLRVILCGHTELSYLVGNGACWAHGATLHEARDGLLYKIGNRDLSAFKGWKLDRVVSKRDAILAYRTITGACEKGVREWMLHQGVLPNKTTIRNVIKLTKGAYGAEEFRKFFINT